MGNCALIVLVQLMKEKAKSIFYMLANLFIRCVKVNNVVCSLHAKKRNIFRHVTARVCNKCAVYITYTFIECKNYACKYSNKYDLL